MANVKRCDRCKTIFEPGFLATYGIEKHKGVPPGKWYDLCPDCLRDFDEWMDQKHTGKNVASNG